VGAYDAAAPARVLLEIQLSVSQGAELEHGGATAYGPSKHLLYVALSTNDPRTTADALLNQ
jgi:hypothetical protein